MNRDYCRKLVVLQEIKFNGGDVKLVESECNCFMVLTRIGEKVKVEVYDDKDEAESRFSERVAGFRDNAVPALSGC